jgi:glucose-1-phosphate cytidylyltransferase
MKVVILAGGLGTRLSEETELKPKPMVTIGNKPILWHIMKIYSYYGYNEFVILAGFKEYAIKEYFANYWLHESDITFELRNQTIEIHQKKTEDWKVTILNTGLNTMTGGRVYKAKDYLKDQTFLLTYGDGLCDINIRELVNYHKSHGKIATITSIQPEGRFGGLEISDDFRVKKFVEKPKGDNSWINGGYFVCEPSFFNYLVEEDELVLEKDPLENLAKDNQLVTYKHSGFWKCMDTLRDRTQLQSMWSGSNPPWKVW